MKEAKKIINKLTGQRETKWTLEKVQETLLKIDQTNPDPFLIQDIRLYLSAEYTRLSSLLTYYRVREAKKWLEIKEKSKSIKEADVRTKTTEEYLKRSAIENRMKAIEKLMASTKSQLEVWNKETWGSF